MIFKANNSDGRPASRWLRTVWFSLALIGISFVVAPLATFRPDMTILLPWAQASGGLRPWACYQLCRNCNYPPFLLYLITAVQAVRVAMGATGEGTVAYLLMKAPSIVALGLGCCAIGWLAAKSFGLEAAQAAGIRFAACPALWLNATVWGQFDVLLSLELVLATPCAIPRGAGWCGVFVCVSIATKV